MYKCKPIRSVAQTRIMLFGGFGAAAAATFAGAAIKNYGTPLRALGFVILCVTVMLMIRFVLSEYEYTVDGESFTVTRITGKKRTEMCCLSLYTATGVITKEEYRALPRGEKATIRYSLNQNVKAESYCFLCDFNGSRTMVEFEPNAPFVEILRSQIEQAHRFDSEKDGETDL